MRRRRKFDRMLMTTALVLVSAVFVVFSIRLIMRSNDTDHAPQFLPADEMFLVGLTTSGSGSDALPDGGVGLIDRYLVDVDPKQHDSSSHADESDGATSTSSPTTLAPTTSTTTPSTTTRDPKAFESVDIRYYVKSKVGLNMREEPSTNSNILQQLDYGTPLRVIGLNDEWAKVRLPGMVFGYVSREFITIYKPATEPTTTTTLTPSTTAQGSTTRKTTVKPPEGALSFINPPKGGSNQTARDNFAIIEQYGLINKEGSPSINRHYERFTDNGDGTITVDGVLIAYSQKMGARYATHYDGVEVCRYQIKNSSTGKCSKGHTTPTCHGTASGLLAQRGIVAVSYADSSIYPRGSVVFVVGYGIAVVGDRSGGNFDLCYDADECRYLTRSNWTSGIYLITTSP